VPVCYAGNLMNYRIEASKKAGFSEFPKTTDEFLAYAKAMRRKARRAAWRWATPRRRQRWIYWCLWAHGGNHVDKNDKITINSAEPRRRLNFAKALYAEMVPGTASWNDAFTTRRS